jgi:glycosyltransferase involved in cell wall biosynthesis
VRITAAVTAPVIHLRSSGGLYGAEQMLLGLCSEQQRRGSRPLLIAFADPREGTPALLTAAAQRGLPVQRLDCRGVFDLGCLRALRRQLLAAGDQAVLHCHDYKSVCYGRIAARGLKLRRVATAHGWVGGGPRLRAWRALELRVLRGFDRVCAVSASIAAQLRAAGIAPARVVQIDNGIDLERFRMREGAREHGALRLGTAARLSPEKNLGQLIEALAQCRALGVGISLTIYGEGPQRAELQSLIERLQLHDRVTLPGMRDSLEDWYPGLDAFVLVSLTEGMPLSVLEALACGRPVLASDVGALPVMLDGLPGCRVLPVADYAALTGALCALPARMPPDPRLRQRVAERYGLTHMADAYDDVYRQAQAA